MPDRKTIGETLRKIRGERSGRQMAKLLGVSKSSVFMYEAGEREPKSETKIKYANMANSTVGAIFYGE